jgi:hypothetical protein
VTERITSRLGGKHPNQTEETTGKNRALNAACNAGQRQRQLLIKRLFNQTAFSRLTAHANGWTPYNGPVGVGGALSSIYYVSNNFYGPASSVELESGSLALSGNSLSVGLYQDSAISQTGLVPTNAESLQFEASSPIPGVAGFLVTLGGQSLSYSVLSEGPDYTDVYGANIPANLDGLTEALTFSCLGNGSGNVLLDDIDFSPMSVPEPSEYALIGLGAILFGLRHLKGRFIYLSRRGTSAHGSSAVAPLDAASLPY